MSRRSSTVDDVGRVTGSRQVERPRSAVRGTGMVVALPVDFGDVPARRAVNAPSRYADLFFGDDYPHGGGSLDRYWRDMSYGTFGIDGTVAQWRRMPRPRSAYAGRRGGMGAFPGNSQSLLEDAVRANDGTIDFGRYDNDGPDGRPNSGDDDGVVDAVFLVYAGTGAAEDGDLAGIWPHAWRRSVSTNDRAAGGGTIRVDRYAALPERMADVGSDGDLLTVGLAAHEYGHVLGLPDLVDHEDAPGPGRWDLMGTGVWGFRDSSRPTGLSSWSRARLGWTTPQLLQGDHPGHSMPSTYAARSTVKLPVHGQPLHEHVLVERRTRTGFDADLPADGLLVWHVDDSQPADGTGSHARVELLPADGAANGDAGDLLRPGAHLSDSTRPSTRAHDGSESMVAIQNVREAPGWSVDLHAGRASLAPVIDASIEAGGPQAAPPIVALTTPAANAFVRGVVTMTCEASGSPDISRLAFTRAGGATGLSNVNVNPSAPSVVRTFDWSSTSVADGPETLGCRARNTANQWTDSAHVPVVVDNAPPTQSAPGDGATAPDIATQTDTSSLSAHWSAGSDATSGIASYDWRFCTTTACATILASGSATGTTVTARNLALAVGTTYHGCIQAVDRAGNVSGWTCSDGVQVVAAAPTMGLVRDGASGPDVQFQASTTTMAMNWDAATGGTGGVASYQWRACTTVACTTILASGSTTALAASAGGLALTSGTTYVGCVRATSGSGDSSAYACSNGVTVDATSPTMAPPGDGPAAPDLQFQAGSTSLSAFWSAASDGTGSGVASYSWRFCTTPDCATILASGTGAGLAATATGLSLSSGSTYVACVRATDAVGNVGTFECSDGVTVDTSAPTVPTPNDGATAPDVDQQASTTQLDANWTAASDGTGSGVAGYDWRFCTAPACGTVLASGSGTGTTATATGLSLTAGSTYHACVRATDRVGNVGAWSCSDGVVVSAGPTVTIDAPTTGAQLRGTVAITASAVDADGVTRFEYRVDGVLRHTDGPVAASSPRSSTWNMATTTIPVPDGAHTVEVRAFDAGGMSGSASVTVTVDNTAPGAPTFSGITAGSTISGTALLSSSGTDGQGIVRADYAIAGPTIVHAATTSPQSSFSHSWSWNTTAVADGNHTMRVTLHDAAGNSASTPLVRYVVHNAGDVTPPTGAIDPSLSGATLTGAVTLLANVSDDNAIVKVEFLIDGALVSTADTGMPAGYVGGQRARTWSSSVKPNGSYVLSARVTDAGGNVTTTAGVTVTVSN